jgi:hypothetical protein
MMKSNPRPLALVTGAFGANGYGEGRMFGSLGSAGSR